MTPIDNDGCRTFAEMIGEHVVEKVYPQIPCMLSVDHSLTGGVFEKLITLASPEKVRLVVLDSHTDALTAPLLWDAISYDMDNNPDSLWRVQPKNLYIIGIGDYPPKHSFRIKDPRIKRYTEHYSWLKKMGVTLITKKELMSSTSKVRNILKRIDTPHMYVSVDMDVGAGNALSGVRFTNRRGLKNKFLKEFIKELEKDQGEETP